MIVLDNILVQFVFKVKRNLNYNDDDDDDDDLTKNFIFTETNATRHVMTFRELCAIESAAKHNPKSIIRVFSINAIINDTDLVEEYINNYVSEYVRGERSPIFNWTEGMARKCITCIYGANL
jgi:hypothetical protein